MRRRFGQFLTLLSTLLFIFFAALWNRSIAINDQWGILRQTPPSESATSLLKAHAVCLYSTGGKCVFVYFPLWFSSQSVDEPRIDWHHNPRFVNPIIDELTDAPKSLWNKMGFAMGKSRIFREPRLLTAWRMPPTYVVAPYWLFLVITGIRPALWVRNQIRHWRWRVKGKCAVCGYDLRETPERCPECGTAVPPAP